MSHIAHGISCQKGVPWNSCPHTCSRWICLHSRLVGFQPHVLAGIIKLGRLVGYLLQISMHSDRGRGFNQQKAWWASKPKVSLKIMNHDMSERKNIYQSWPVQFSHGPFRPIRAPTFSPAFRRDACTWERRICQRDPPPHHHQVMMQTISDNIT